MFASAFRAIFKPFDSSRKCAQSSYYYLDDPNQSQSQSIVDLEASCCVGGETKYPVNIEDFSRHVAQLHADGDIGFSKEYELIQNECIVEEHSSEHSQHSDNKSKNRYLNIIACKFLLLFFSLTFPTTVHSLSTDDIFLWVSTGGDVLIQHVEFVFTRVNLNHIN